MKKISLPKIGIRPVIDGRRMGVRESLEEQTMNMAKATAALLTEKLRHACGAAVECVISDTCIAGMAEAAACEEKFSSQNVGLTITVTQFGHIHRLDFHSQPGFKEVVINNGTGDTHRNAAQRQIAFTFHAGDGQTGAGKAQQFFFNIGRNRCVIGILNVMTVNGECRMPFWL